jgi:hypothetical protein
MNLSLDKKRQRVNEAKAHMDAARAFDKHQTLKAKKSCKTLMVSTKGLTTAFMAGVIKEATSGQPMTASKASTIAAKRLFSIWLV